MLIPLTVALLLILDHSPAALLAVLAAALHEIAHLVAARLLHVPTTAPRLSPVGARIALDRPMLSYRDEAIIAAAGPAVNLVCLAFALLLLRQTGSSTAFAFAAANLALAAVNLLPLRTLDGGRILEVIVSTRISPIAAERTLALTTAVGSAALFIATAALALRDGANLSLLLIAVSLCVRIVVDRARGR